MFAKKIAACTAICFEIVSGVYRCEQEHVEHVPPSRFSVSQKQLAVRIEDFAQDHPGLTQIAMYLPLPNSHRCGYSVRIKDRPSSSFTFPFVGVTGCRICVLFQGGIWAKGRNALKRRTNGSAQVLKTGHLLYQFSRDNVLLDGVTERSSVRANILHIRDRANAAVFLPHEIAPHRPAGQRS